MKLRRFFAFFAILLLLIPLFVIPSSAASVRRYVFVGGMWDYEYTSYTIQLGFRVNDSETIYKYITRNVSGTLVRYGVTTYEHNFAKGDVLILNDDLVNYPDYFQAIVNDLFVPDWVVDDSSLYRSIYSTLGHYLFNDDFTSVPYGDYWISGISIFCLIAVALLPFLAVFWIVRKFFF